MKNNKTILVVIISLLLIAVAGIFLYVKTLDRCGVPENQELASGETAGNNESKDFDIAKAEEILDYFGFNEVVGCDSKIYSYIYNDSYKKVQALKKVDSAKIKKVKCSDIYSKELLKDDVYKGKYGVCDKDSTTEVVPYDEVNQIYKKMYDTDMEKEGFDTADVSGYYYNMYDYDKKLDSFVKLECGGCGGVCGPERYLIQKTKSAKIAGNDLTIEVYYLYGAADYNEYTEKNIYNLHTLKISKTIDVNSVEEFKKEVLNKYLDKLDVYEVKFEKKGNDYIFKSLSKKLS